MRLHTKALYNLLRYNYLEDPSIFCEPWQIEDLREVDTEELFNRLSNFGIALDKRHFILYAMDCDDPEDLSECLIVDNKSAVKQDQIYLVIFELWRRLLPEKPSLSVFCDELDHRVFLYDKGNLETDELIEDAVANLLDILDENIDEGKDPKEVFLSISKYCAHDLESFLYDYIADQVDEDNNTYAGDLIENYYQFVTNWRWFDFLRVRIVAKTDILIANDIIKKIILDEKERPDIDLSLEILKFMVQEGDPELFVRLAKLTLPNLKIEADLLELLETIAEFYRRLDEEEKDLAIQKIIDQRANIDGLAHINKNDKDIIFVDSILTKPKIKP
jgi:hypothetical protein